jgi:hypothetical protein
LDGGGGRYYNLFLHQIREELFLKLLPHFDLELRALLLVTESLATNKSRLLHRVASAFILDKRFIVQHHKFSIAEFREIRDNFIKSGDFSSALSVGSVALLIWPLSINVWYKQAWLYFVTGRHCLAVEALRHVSEFPGGIEFLLRSEIVRNNQANILSVGKEGVELLDLLNGVEIKESGRPK